MYGIIFLKNVRYIAKKRGMTLADMQELSGISAATLCITEEVKNNKKNPSLKTMEILSESLKVPLQLLLNPRLEEIGDPIDFPANFEYVSAYLPPIRALLVKKWSEETASIIDILRKPIKKQK